MRERHKYHRRDIKNNQCGLGTHFFKHAEEMGIDMDSNMEEIMQHFKLIIIRSAAKCTVEEWKDMEASWMQILKTTEEYGGINKILERRYDQKQYQCEQCDYNSKVKCNVQRHMKVHMKRNEAHPTTKRKHDQKQYQCEQCDFRANGRNNISDHKRRKYTDYKVLCERCGYRTN